MAVNVQKGAVNVRQEPLELEGSPRCVGEEEFGQDKPLFGETRAASRPAGHGGVFLVLRAPSQSFRSRFVGAGLCLLMYGSDAPPVLLEACTLPDSFCRDENKTGVVLHARGFLGQF